jgi:hypothetical protein
MARLTPRTDEEVRDHLDSYDRSAAIFKTCESRRDLRGRVLDLLAVRMRDPVTATTALQLLWDIGTPSALPFVETAMGLPDETTARTAREMLTEGHDLLAGFRYPGVDETDIFGRWKVVGHLSAGISSMSSAQADRWIGKEADYTRAVARFDVARCANASYDRKIVVADRYFLNGFRIRPREVGIDAEWLPIFEVKCGGGDWLSPGSLLILKSTERLLVAWDGVFFELAR